MVARVAALIVVLAATARADPDQDAKAKDAADAGTALFQANDFAGAVSKFEEAYELNHDPSYLFNVAQAYRHANDCVHAADYYGRFLDLVPHPPNEEKIRVWYAQERKCATEHAQPGTLPKPEPVKQEPPPEPVGREPPALVRAGSDDRGLVTTPIDADLGGSARTRAYVVGGVGVGLLGLGTTIGLIGKHEFDSSTSYAARSNWKDVVRYGSTGLFVAGVGSITTAVILYVRAPRGKQGLAVAPLATDRSLVIVVGGAL